MSSCRLGPCRRDDDDDDDDDDDIDRDIDVRCAELKRRQSYARHSVRSNRAQTI